MSKDEPSDLPVVQLSSDQPKPVDQVVKEQISEGLHQYDRKPKKVFLSSIIAGLDLGFSLFLMGCIYTLFHGAVSDSSLHVMMAFAYPIGFLFVVLGGSVLFTEHTTLAVLPVLDGRKRIVDLLRLWIIIYFGNIVGGLLIGGLIAWLGPALEVVSIEALSYLALHLTEQQGLYILGSGVLAGWLMGLLSWLVTSSQDTLSRILIVILITTVIGIGSLHHCIVGSIELFAGFLVSDEMTLQKYIPTQLWATLGNIIGGAFFVSILKFQMSKDT